MTRQEQITLAQVAQKRQDAMYRMKAAMRDAIDCAHEEFDPAIRELMRAKSDYDAWTTAFVALDQIG